MPWLQCASDYYILYWLICPWMCYAHTYLYVEMSRGILGRKCSAQRDNKSVKCYSSFYHLPPPLSFAPSLHSSLSITSVQCSCSYQPLTICDQRVCAHISCAHRLFVSLTRWVTSTRAHTCAKHLRQHIYAQAHMVPAQTHPHLNATCSFDVTLSACYTCRDFWLFLLIRDTLLLGMPVHIQSCDGLISIDLMFSCTV